MYRIERKKERLSGGETPATTWILLKKSYSHLMRGYGYTHKQQLFIVSEVKFME